MKTDELQKLIQRIYIEALNQKDTENQEESVETQATSEGKSQDVKSTSDEKSLEIQSTFQEKNKDQNKEDIVLDDISDLISEYSDDMEGEN